MSTCDLPPSDQSRSAIAKTSPNLPDHVTIDVRMMSGRSAEFIVCLPVSSAAQVAQQARSALRLPVQQRQRAVLTRVRTIPRFTVKVVLPSSLGP
eukprot:1424655-Amphidinium_carterae.1